MFCRGKHRHARRTGLWGLKFVTYSGMTVPLAGSLERGEALHEVRRRNRRARRRGYHVSYVGHNAWEHCPPDDAGMVGDGDGYLVAFVERE
jgi:hypothetical protein